MLLSGWSAAECELRDAGSKNVTFILGEMRERRRKGEGGTGRVGEWVAGRGLGTTV